MRNRILAIAAIAAAIGTPIAAQAQSTVGVVRGGTVIVEYVFARPGLGTLMVDAVFKRDYAVLQTLVLLAAATFILASLAIDLLYGVIDPRLRVRGSEAGR